MASCLRLSNLIGVEPGVYESLVCIQTQTDCNSPLTFCWMKIGRPLEVPPEMMSLLPGF